MPLDKLGWKPNMRHLHLIRPLLLPSEDREAQRRGAGSLPAKCFRESTSFHCHLMERTPQTPLTKSVSHKSPERPSVVADPRYARGISPRAQQRAVVVQRRHLLRWKRRAQHFVLLRARSLAAAHATVGVRIWFAL